MRRTNASRPLRALAGASLAGFLLFAACGGEAGTAGGDPADTTQAPVAPADTAASAPAGPAEAADVVALLRGDPRFTTFVAALDSAGLAEPLRDAGPYTVFAPTDDAFAALPAGTLDDLLRPGNRDRLRDVLLFHVVQGAHPRAALRDTTLMAQQAGLLAVRTDGAVAVNGHPVVEADLEAGNGYVHALGAVLLPDGP